MRYAKKFAQSRSSKFSGKLTTLARDIIPGVWLTHIHLSQNGQQIYLEGAANDSVLITQFFQRLKQSAGFASKEFKIFKIVNSKNFPANMDFALGTQAEVTTTATTTEKPAS